MRIGHHIALTTLAAAAGGLLVSGVLWQTYDGFQQDANATARNALVLRDAEHLDATQALFLKHADAVYYLSEGLDPAGAKQVQELTWAHWEVLQAALQSVDEAMESALVHREISAVREICIEICSVVQSLSELNLSEEGDRASVPGAEPSIASEALTARLLDANRQLDSRFQLIGDTLETLVQLRVDGLEARRHELELQVLLTLAAYLFSTCLLWLWSSRRIAVPLVLLSRAAVEASRGGTDFRFKGLGDLVEVRTLADSVAEFVRKLENNRDQLEDEVARRTQELMRANQAKSEFLAHMSHELRTPMAAILGFGELLQSENPTQTQLDEYSDSILRNARHLLALLNDILDLSKIEAGQMSPENVAFEPRALAEEVYELLSPRAMEKGIDFFLQVGEDVPHSISSDPTRLRQILINLCGNAIKFTAEGGVQLEVGFERSSGGDLLCCKVVDSGIGIHADKIETIFEAFAQADSSTTRRFGGTGLGLAISRRLARILGGDLRLESRLGRGSTFELQISAEIVAERPAPELPAPTKRAAGALSRGFRGRVLVVDDVPVNRRLMSIQLEKLGIEVEVAVDGLRAVEAILEARDAGRGFDAVLMDMQMPVMDGYEATRKLRRSGIELPVYALTAHAMSGDRELCIEAGCDGYLTKPVDRGALIRALQEVLEPGEDSGRAA